MGKLTHAGAGQEQPEGGLSLLGCYDPLALQTGNHLSSFPHPYLEASVFDFGTS